MWKTKIMTFKVCTVITYLFANYRPYTVRNNRKDLRHSLPILENWNNDIQSYLRTNDLYGPLRNAFDAGSIHYEASGRGLGPGMEIETLLGTVKWHQADRRVPFGAQKSRMVHKTYLGRWVRHSINNSGNHRTNPVKLVLFKTWDDVEEASTFGMRIKGLPYSLLKELTISNVILSDPWLVILSLIFPVLGSQNLSHYPRFTQLPVIESNSMAFLSETLIFTTNLLFHFPVFSTTFPGIVLILNPCRKWNLYFHKISFHSWVLAWVITCNL